MNLSEAELIERLSAIPGYVDAFDRGVRLGRDHAAQDRACAGRVSSAPSIRARPPSTAGSRATRAAIDAAAKRGFDLFNGKARCSGCHNGYALTDGSFHDIGTAHGDDIGRGRLFPTSVKLRYAFKTPTLRDVARRAPYMHDGSVATLDEVIDLYDRGGIDRPSRSALIFPLQLTSDEKADLIAFLQTLNSPPQPFAVPVAAALTATRRRSRRCGMLANRLWHRRQPRAEQRESADQQRSGAVSSSSTCAGKRSAEQASAAAKHNADQTDGADHGLLLRGRTGDQRNDMRKACAGIRPHHAFANACRLCGALARVHWLTKS